MDEQYNVFVVAFTLTQYFKGLYGELHLESSSKLSP
uniref:Uncharacterized protein n=1 Tax=Rhizophora mucronata TaxID=61149 RepID=A0A2P2R319_RHIMU